MSGRPAERRGEDLVGEGGQDHVDDGGLQGAADEPAAHRAGRVFAHAVGFHPGFLEQPAVLGELTVGGVPGGGELELVLERPALGVLGVEGLVQRDAEAAQHRARFERAGEQLLARPEQPVCVEVDLA